MTRLDAMRALLELPAIDTLSRASNQIYKVADAHKMRIDAVKIQPKPKRRNKVTSRLSWVRSVHERQGA
jgi:hypothetical protein